MGRATRTLVVVAFTLVSCSSQVVPAATPPTRSVVLRLYATTATIPLANELTNSYSQRYPGVTFDMQSGDYDAVVNEMMAEDDAYVVSNHLPADSTLWAAPIGQDGIAVIVHPDNDIANLTTEQLRDIYQGRVSNWKTFGGPDLPIDVISREDGSGTRAEFERLVMGDRRTTRSAVIVPSSAAMVTAVGRSVGAIGYVSMSYLTQNVGSVAVDGTAPTLENVADNSYPLRSTLFIIGKVEPQNDFRAFVGWVQSPEGQAVVSREYAPVIKP